MSIEGSNSIQSLGQKCMAFIDSDNLENGFTRALTRRGITEAELSYFSLERLVGQVPGQRKYFFGAMEVGGTPKPWITNLRGVQGHIFKYGVLRRRPGRPTKQEGVDIMLAVEAMRLAHNNTIDSCLILSDDGDMLPLIEYLVETGVRTAVCGFNDPDRNEDEVASWLRDAADLYTHMGSVILSGSIDPKAFAYCSSSIPKQDLDSLGTVSNEIIGGVEICCVLHENGEITLFNQRYEDLPDSENASWFRFRQRQYAEVVVKLLKVPR